MGKYAINLRGLSLVGAVLLMICTATGVELDDDEFVKPKLLEEFRISPNGEPIVLPVKLGGKTYSFLLDSGSATTTFDISLREFLGEPKIKRDAGKDEEGNLREFNIYYAPDAKLGKLSFLYGGTVFCVDLTPLRESTGLDIRGVIGVGFMRRYMLQLDFDSGKLRIFKSGSAKQIDLGDVVKMDLSEYGCPFVVGKILDKYQCSFIIDTGYPDSGSLSGDLFAKLSELGKIHGITRGITNTDGKVRTTTETRMSEMELGTHDYKGLIFEHSSRGNMLGLGFLSRHTVTLDFPNLEMYLKKGKRFEKIDQNDMSGLHLLRKTSGVVVDSIDKNSPAVIAGIKPGDIIVKIDGKFADKCSLTELRNILRNKDGKTMEIEFKRTGKTQKTTLALKKSV